MKSQTKKPDRILAMVQQAASSIINNPTKAMEATFASLPIGHQWMLFALLDCGRWVKETELIEAYERLCPEEHVGPAAKLIAELNESFLHIERFAATILVQWTHPTCKDLAVQMLAANHKDRQRFLRQCEQEGLRIAFSVGAGSTGKIHMPLLKAKKDWLLASERLKREPHGFALSLVLEPLKLKTESSGFDQVSLQHLARDVCLHVRKTQTGKWSNNTLTTYLTVRQMVSLNLATPGLAAHLRELLNALDNHSWLSDPITDGFADYVDDLAKFCAAAATGNPCWWSLLSKCPTFLSAASFLAHATEQYDDNFSEGLTLAAEFREASDAFEKLSNALASLSLTIKRAGRHDLLALSQRCSSSSSFLNNRAWEKSDDHISSEPPATADEENENLSLHDLKSIFADL
jgi:hypothetical protein